MKTAIQSILSIWLLAAAGSAAHADTFTDRQQAANAQARQDGIQAELDDFLRGNAYLQKNILAFAKTRGGLADGGACKVGTNYSCGNGPCTPYGTTTASVSDISGIRGATFGCELNLRNGYACHVDTEITVGDFYNTPASCQRSRNVRLWADCYDSAGKEVWLCY